jgi:ATP-binding cassette subfamily B multidrug efflux pump
MSNFSTDKQYLAQYMHYVMRHKKRLLLSLCAIPLIAGIHIAQPLILKYAIDHVFLAKAYDKLHVVASLLAVAVVAEFSLRSLQSFLFQHIGQHTVTDIRHDLFKHVSSLKMSYFDRTPQGMLTSRLTSDLESLNDSFATGVVTLIADVLTIIGILTAMLFLSVELTVITLIITPPLFMFVNICRKQLRTQYNAIRSTIGKLNASIQEQLEGLPIIQQYNRQRVNESEFDTLNTAYRKATISSVSYDALLYSVIESMASITLGIVIGYALGFQQSDAITIGLLVAFIDYIQKFFQPLKEISNKFAILQHALASLEKIFGLFNETDTIQTKPLKLHDFSGKITLSNLHFSYPSHPDKPVINGISFDVHPGQTIAIVGPTGSGKSSLIKLFLGLYDGYTGSICMDGKELNTLDCQSVRRQMVTVGQDAKLFNRSIAFNITLGNPNISEDQVLKALTLANAMHIVNKRPKGIHDTIHQFGQQLSAGEAQLIGFARALASSAPVILLDEATANIDSLSEHAIQQATNALLQEKTVIVIAHRLSTIQHADTIIALKNGHIIEQGNHAELMAANGFYAKLYGMQFTQGSPLNIP